MNSVVIDASVWVAAVDPEDPERKVAERFLTTLAGTPVRIVVPALARIEVACALSRRLGEDAVARSIANAFFDNRLVREAPVDSFLAHHTVKLGTSLRLRASDAVYAALAEIEGASLVTLDQELITRAGGLSPEEWLATQ